MAGSGRVCRWGTALVICVALVLSSQGTEAVQKIKKFLSQDMEVHWVETGRVKRGVITTPGFGLPPWRREPGPYRAAWLLQKQPGYQLVVYFTQNHLAYGDVSLYSFVACISEGHNKKDADCYWDSPERGPHSIASSETNRILVDGATSSAQPQNTANWLVVVANVTDEPGATASMCLPSSRSHGLNFTYEMERMSVGQSRVRHRCSLRSCNLNGECVVSADFKKYYCACQPGFSGTGCEHGPLCDPPRQINPCHNNGTCRQIRDIVECKCPLDYKGDRCEKKMRGVEDPQGCRFWAHLRTHQAPMHVPSDPRRPLCHHGCAPDLARAVYKCACHPGFQMAAEAGQQAREVQTCQAKALRRYVIQVAPLANGGITLSNENVEHRLNFSHSLFTEAKPLQVMPGSGTGLIKLSLLAQRDQEQALFSWFASRVKNGTIGIVQVRQTLFTFHSEPKLLISSLGDEDSNHRQPRRVGSRARLNCQVLGSRRARVDWYKDDILINVTRASVLRAHPITRGSVEPSSPEESFNHFLHISSVQAEDQGRFECRARDGDDSQSRAVELYFPQLHFNATVSPPRVTARVGDNVTLSCSLRHKLGNVTFSWSKAIGLGELRPIHGGDPEQVYNYCLGLSVLFIPRAETARYECEVNAGVLSSRTEAHVRAIPSGAMTCRQVKDKHNITWQETLGEAEDLQPCPETETTIVLPGTLIRVPVRYARRRCVRNGKRPPSWAPPDLSDCVDRELFILQRQVNQLMAGYDVNTTSEILHRVNSLVQSRLRAAHERGEASITAAEVALFRRLFCDIVSYMLKVSADEEFENLERPALESVVPLLTKAGSRLKDQEKVQLLKAQLAFLRRLVFSTKKIDAPTDTFVGSQDFEYRGNEVTILMRQHVHSRPGWLGAVADVTVHADNPWHAYEHTQSRLGLVVVVNRHSHLLFPLHYTPPDNPHGIGRADATLRLDSPLVSVGLGKRPRRIESPSPPGLTLSLQLRPLSLHWHSVNQSHSCARLDDSGRWRLDACALTQTGNFSFNCSCDRLGTYALALVTRPRSRLHSTLRQLHWPVTIGCLISLLLLVYSAALQLRLLCRRPSIPAVLQLQCAVVLSAAMAVFMVAARDRPPQSSMSIIAAALQCLTLSALGVQMAVKMHVLGQVKLSSGRGDPKFFECIVFFVSLGVPAIITWGSWTSQHTTGWDELQSWWIKHISGGSNSFFYGVVVPMGCLFLVDSALLLFVRALLARHLWIDRSATDWVDARVKLMTHSHIIEMALVLMIATSAVYINHDGLAVQVLFAVFCVLTSVAVFWCYVVRTEQRCLLPACSRKPKKNDSEAGDSNTQAPATLRSHSVLRASDKTQEPLLNTCRCKKQPSPTTTDSSAGTETCTVSSSAEGSSDSQRCSPVEVTEAVERPAAARKTPIATSEEEDDISKYDPPSKPLRVELSAMDRRTSEGGRARAGPSGVRRPACVEAEIDQREGARRKKKSNSKSGALPAGTNGMY